MISLVQASNHSSLVREISKLLTETGKETKTKFIFQYFDIPAQLPTHVFNQTFFIVQEATDNILKHAHANHAFIQLYCRDGELIISIEDDGVGFDFVSEKGKGLWLLENRVAGLRGSVEFSSDDGSGTSIMIVIPLTQLEKI